MSVTTAKQSRQHHPPALRLLCRKQYVRGEVGSLAQLAKQHRISDYTIRDWAESDDWTGQRQRWLEKQSRADENPEPPATNPLATPLPEVQFDDLGSLSHARAREYEVHLIRLRAQLADEVEAAKIDRLAAAISRLEDVFCRHAGIPQPGSRKPERERPKPQKAWVDPV